MLNFYRSTCFGLDPKKSDDLRALTDSVAPIKKRTPAFSGGGSINKGDDTSPATATLL